MKFLSFLKKTIMPDPIRIGEQYFFKKDLKNPFEQPFCQVTDIKNGFVQYRYWGSGNDQPNGLWGPYKSSPESDFRSMFAKRT